MRDPRIDPFLTASLEAHPEGEKAARILAHSINGADPARGVRNHVQRVGKVLQVGEKVYQLDDARRVLLIGFGKASPAMGREAARLLGDHVSQGLLLSKGPVERRQTLHDHPEIEIIHAGHPLPDQRGLEAARSIRELLQSSSEKDLIIFLISGGGSALLSLPVEGITLQEWITLNKQLLGCGATIQEINTVRKHLSRVKGGQLARAAAPAAVLNLILSDVVGDRLDMVASGPTLPDPTTYADALDVVQRYRLASRLPSSVVAHLKNGTLGKEPETPKPGDPIFERVQTMIVGSNLQAARAGLRQARQEGFHTLHLTSAYQGEAREVGRFLAGVLRHMASNNAPLQRPACLVAGGEATVTLDKGSGTGRGGRNQELVLSSVRDLAGINNAVLVALATDGNDGPTDAAGAVVSGDTWRRGKEMDLLPVDFLANHNAYAYFDALGDLLKPGLTGTNVNDLIFLFTFAGGA